MLENNILDFVQKCKVVANVLPCISAPNDERQQEQVSMAKQLRVTCNTESNPGKHNGSTWTLQV